MVREVLVIAGSAECLWDDVIRFNEIIGSKKFYDVMCINYTGLYWPYNFQHWVSLHTEILISSRRMIVKDVITHSNRMLQGIDRVWNIDSSGADSGLFACKVAMGLMYQKIVLCGMPLDQSRKFFDRLEVSNHFDAHSNISVWKSQSQDFEGKIKSMSGNTMKMVGFPTKEWLNGKQN